MKKGFHRAMGVFALLIISSFFFSTIVVEMTGTAEQIATVKRFIVYGLVLLIPAMGMTARSGLSMAKNRVNAHIAKKMHRMRLIGMNGLLVLVPCALILNYFAANHEFGPLFVTIQMFELIAGAVNISLMCLMIRDGLRSSRGNFVGERGDVMP